jgi:bifunctional non-homologous end joining protein LigD
MLRSFDFCLPTRSTTVPDGEDWLHEVKYDGYRLRVEHDGDRMRLIRFVIDGEAVVLGVGGISDFDALHSGRHNDEVQLCAFDILIEGDDDLRKLPLSMRKVNLERLLARRPEGIFVNPFERGENDAPRPKGRRSDGRMEADFKDRYVYCDYHSSS